LVAQTECGTNATATHVSGAVSADDLEIRDAMLQAS